MLVARVFYFPPLILSNSQSELNLCAGRIVDLCVAVRLIEPPNISIYHVNRMCGGSYHAIVTQTGCVYISVMSHLLRFHN